MADNDLIRRGDALELVLKLSADDNASWGVIMEDLRALPAAEVAPHDPAKVQALTAEQGAIISAYTGYMAGSFSALHAYAERKLGRPIWTHQFPSVADELREAAKADFVGIAAMKEG